MWECHVLNFVAITLTVTRSSATYHIITSKEFDSIDLELNFMLFHNKDKFMSSLVGSIAHCIIVFLVISNPS